MSLLDQAFTFGFGCGFVLGVFCGALAITVLL